MWQVAIFAPATVRAREDQGHLAIKYSGSVLPIQISRDGCRAPLQLAAVLHCHVASLPPFVDSSKAYITVAVFDLAYVFVLALFGLVTEEDMIRSEEDPSKGFRETNSELH